MNYLMQQYEEVKRAIETGGDIRDILAIKWYVQELMAEQIEKYLSPSSSVLEVGCGGSLTLHFLNLRGHRAIGVDINPECVRYSMALGAALGSNVTIVRANAFELPFEDRQFDYVYSVGMLEHYPLDKQRGLFDEIRRVSREYLHLEVPNPHPLSTFYTIGLRSDEVHLQCNPGLLMAESDCALIEVDGRCVFDALGEVKKNPPLHSFIQRRAPHLLIESFAAPDISRLCDAERAASRAERLVYGFQLSWIARLNGLMMP
jgi:SAM-dependent methyltransferase